MEVDIWGEGYGGYAVGAGLMGAGGKGASGPNGSYTTQIWPPRPAEWTEKSAQEPVPYNMEEDFVTWLLEKQEK